MPDFECQRCGRWSPMENFGRYFDRVTRDETWFEQCPDCREKMTVRLHIRRRWANNGSRPAPAPPTWADGPSS